MAITPGGRVGDASPLGKKGGPRRLDDYVREVAHALMRKHGWTESHAIAVARNSMAKWAVKSKNPAVRGAAAAAIVHGKMLDHQPRR